MSTVIARPPGMILQYVRFPVVLVIALGMALDVGLASGAPLHHEQGAAATGVGGSATARVQGPSSLYYNPAGMPWSPGVSVEIGGAVILPFHELHLPGSNAPLGIPGRRTTGVVQTRLTPVTPPAVFAVATLRNLSFGLGVFSPLVHSLSWPGGRTRSVQADTKVLVVNPALAFRFPILSVGLGADLALGWATSQRAIESGGQEGQLHLQGPGTGLGFNGGIRVTPLKDLLSFGLAYRSRVFMGFVQQATFSGPPEHQRCDPDGPCLHDGRAFSDVTLPDVMSVGLEVVPLAATHLSLDVLLTVWTGLPPGQVVFQDRRTASLSQPRQSVESPGLHAGVEQGLIWVAPDLKLRGGVVLEKSPVPVSALSPEHPWGDRFGASLGLGWRLFGMSMDAAYAGDVTVPRVAQVNGVQARYQSTTHMVSVSVGYRHGRL